MSNMYVQTHLRKRNSTYYFGAKVAADFERQCAALRARRRGENAGRLVLEAAAIGEQLESYNQVIIRLQVIDQDGRAVRHRCIQISSSRKSTKHVRCPACANNIGRIWIGLRVPSHAP